MNIFRKLLSFQKKEEKSLYFSGHYQFHWDYLGFAPFFMTTKDGVKYAESCEVNVFVGHKYHPYTNSFITVIVKNRPESHLSSGSFIEEIATGIKKIWFPRFATNKAFERGKVKDSEIRWIDERAYNANPLLVSLKWDKAESKYYDPQWQDLDLEARSLLTIVNSMPFKEVAKESF